MGDVLTITWRCPACRSKNETSVQGDVAYEIHCEKCSHTWTWPSESGLGMYCPLCRRGELYRQKDFNPRIGVGIVLVAAVLAWWTYGLSLVAAVLIDVLLYRKVPDVVICYYCFAHYRGLHRSNEYPGFELLKHDKYRARREADTLESERQGEEGWKV